MVLIVFLVFCGSLANHASAQECVVRVVAPSEVDPDISPTFNVSIVAENIPSPGFFGWEVKLSWAPGVINCTSETLNLAIWGAGTYLGPWIPTPIDNVQCFYHQSLTGRAPGTPKTGTHWLLNLTFLVVAEAPAVTSLTISAFPPATYCIADSTAEQIPHQFASATLNIVPEFNQVILISLLMLMSLVSVILSRTLKKTK